VVLCIQPSVALMLRTSVGPFQMRGEQGWKCRTVSEDAFPGRVSFAQSQSQQMSNSPTLGLSTFSRDSSEKIENVTEPTSVDYWP
jgi:hypothetical protein